MNVFDVASGPVIGAVVAVFIAIIAAIGLIVLAIVLLIKSNKKKKWINQGTSYKEAWKIGYKWIKPIFIILNN